MRTIYAADVYLPGLCRVAIVRSPVPHARVFVVDTPARRAAAGVVGVFSGRDLGELRYGRRVRDVPCSPIVLSVVEVPYEGPVLAHRAEERGPGLLDASREPVLEGRPSC